VGRQRELAQLGDLIDLVRTGGEDRPTGQGRADPWSAPGREVGPGRGVRPAGRDGGDARDLTRLVIHRSQLPGADDSTPLLAVSRTGAVTSDITVLTPDDLLTA
jgi:hypothetical protein